MNFQLPNRLLSFHSVVHLRCCHANPEYVTAEHCESESTRMGYPGGPSGQTSPHPRAAITEGIPLQPFEDFKEMRPTDDIQLLVLMTTISQERRGRPDAY